LVQRQLLRQNLHQIQLARLLEVPNSDLEKAIEVEAEKNEALEVEIPLTLPQGSLVQGGLFTPNSGSDEEEGAKPATSSALTESESEDFYGPYNFSAPPSLYEHLIAQLPSLELSPRAWRIAEYLIGNLNEKGFLAEPLPKLTRYLASEPDLQDPPVSVEEVEAVLQKLQRLEPPGIAARSLQECLLLQAQALPETDPHKPLLVRLFTEDYPLLSAGKLSKIQKKYRLSQEEWEALLQKLRLFHHNPAANLTEETAPQVSPDFLLRIEPDGRLEVELVYYRPIRLRVNKAYKKLVESYAEKQTDEETAAVIRHLKDRIERAERFIELLQQREKTLLRIAREIVLHQRAFFLRGCDEKALRPLILQDIAQAVKMDISTISRTVNRKYIQTPCGIFPLKYFFSEGLRTTEGKDISNKAIKKLLQELIAQEDPHKPYSDDKIAKILRQRGIDIQRRTVAKYRQQLGIPSARARRVLPAS